MAPNKICVSTVTGFFPVAFTAADAARSAASAYWTSSRKASSGAAACSSMWVTWTSRSGTSRLTASSIAHLTAGIEAFEPSTPTTTGADAFDTVQSPFRLFGCLHVPVQDSPCSRTVLVGGSARMGSLVPGVVPMVPHRRGAPLTVMTSAAGERPFGPGTAGS